MSVALRIRWPRWSPWISCAQLTPLGALWALELSPQRFPGHEWVEFALGAAVMLQGHEVLRRGLAQGVLRLGLTQDVLATAAALVGFCSSFLVLALDAAGRLPAALHNHRGGPTLFFAEAGTVIFARLLGPSLSYGPPKLAEELKEAGLERSGIPRGLWLSVGGAAALSLAVALAAGAVAGGFARVVSAVLALLGAVSIEALEAARGERIPQAVFLKRAGILTRGEPEVAAIYPFGPSERPEELLQLAAIVEYPVAHPVRDAIFRSCQGHFPTVVRLPGVEHLASRGVRATYQGKQILFGNIRLFREAGWSRGAIEELEHKSRELPQAGETVLFLACDGELRGAICLEEPLLPEAPQAVAQLQRLGAHVRVLSGNSPSSVEGLVRQLGEPGSAVTVHAGLTRPEQERVIEDWRESGRSLALCSPSRVSRASAATTRVEGRSQLSRFVGVLKRRKRRMAVQAKLAWVTGAYHVGVIVLLAGALEPWTGFPPLPVGALMLGTIAPLCLSFVFERLESYNRALLSRPRRRKPTHARQRA